MAKNPFFSLFPGLFTILPTVADAVIFTGNGIASVAVAAHDGTATLVYALLRAFELFSAR